jgi:4-hydroxy-3-methylbut-2-en-1-yl diphosphate synthase IspG/GcpE
MPEQRYAATCLNKDCGERFEFGEADVRWEEIILKSMGRRTREDTVVYCPTCGCRVMIEWSKIHE